jgi:hypothetical protein
MEIRNGRPAGAPWTIGRSRMEDTKNSREIHERFCEIRGKYTKLRNRYRKIQGYTGKSMLDSRETRGDQ